MYPCRVKRYNAAAEKQKKRRKAEDIYIYYIVYIFVACIWESSYERVKLSNMHVVGAACSGVASFYSARVTGANPPTRFGGSLPGADDA